MAVKWAKGLFTICLVPLPDNVDKLKLKLVQHITTGILTEKPRKTTFSHTKLQKSKLQRTTWTSIGPVVFMSASKFWLSAP